MSQMQPEPAESSEMPAEPASVSPGTAAPPPPPLSEAAAAPEPVNVVPAEVAPPVETAAVPPSPPEASTVPITPGGVPPVTPLPAPGAPAQPGLVPSAPKGPDWFALSRQWTAKSQEITVNLLYGAGGWVFGGLLLAALILFQPLIGLGFADGAILLAGLALALALPFDLAGLAIIRYVAARNQAAEAARQALGQNPNLDAATLVKLTGESNAFPPERRAAMDSSLALALYLSIIFTLIGAFFAFWHLSWAVAILFLLACIGGVLLLLRVVSAS